MINHYKWTTKNISVSSLKLDTENPRLSELGEHPSSKQIIEYLFDNENLLDQIKSIVNKGFLPNESPIAYKDKDDYIVLEGNRRVAACKVIIDPLLAPKHKQNSIRKLIENFEFDTIKKLPIIIAKKRADADIIIENRHTGGSQIEKWDKTKQYRFYYKRFIEGESIQDLANKFGRSEGEIKSAITGYQLYDKALLLDLDKEDRDKLKDETKFSITNVERFCNFASGKEFLKLKTNDIKVDTEFTNEEFNKRYKHIVKGILDEKINSRIINDDKQNKKIIEEIKAKENFDDYAFKTTETQNINNIEPTKPTLPAQSTPNPKSTKTSKEKPNNLFYGLKGKSNIKRINEILKEIKTLDVTKHTNAVAVLFRSLLDMIIYQFLQSHSSIPNLRQEEGRKLEGERNKAIKEIQELLLQNSTELDEKILKELKCLPKSLKPDWSPTLFFMLEYLTKDTTMLIDDAKLKSALKAYMNKSSDFLNHFDFNNYVHNEYAPPSASKLKEFAQNFSPLIEYIFEKIAESKNNT